jgi:hypothetical protein
MSALAPAPRHLWEELLAELTGRTGMVHAFGTEDDAKRAPIDHVTWVPDEPSFEPAHFRIEKQEVVELFALRCDVALCGGSALEVCMRAKELAAWMDLLAGPRQGDPDVPPPRPGYDLRAKGKPAAGGTEQARAWRLVLSVTLKDFVVRAYHTAVAASPTLSTEPSSPSALTGTAVTWPS